MVPGGNGVAQAAIRGYLVGTANPSLWIQLDKEEENPDQIDPGFLFVIFL